MKRKKIIVGEDGNTRITITILVESVGLMSYERQGIMDWFAGQAMQAFPPAPYTKIPLVRLKVK